MSGDRLFALLPAIHRLRDGENGPLRALLDAIGREVALVADDVGALYDDLFIETCAEWVIPYIGDLVAHVPLAMPAGQEALARAEVAHSVALRRRKGTLAAVEAAARDATGWSARGVEYFRTLALTQYMQHTRTDRAATASLRDGAALDAIGGPFEELPRTIDIRRIARGRGRHNIPNVGVFVWPVQAWRRSDTPAVALDDRRFLVSPLGRDVPMFHRALAETSIDGLATPLNVPEAIGRRALRRDLGGEHALYGPGPDGDVLGFALTIDGTAVPATRIRACRLDDGGASWINLPDDDTVAVDPERGRIALPTAADTVRVTWHEGFTAAIGGGEYPRAALSLRADEPIARVPADHPTIADALTALDGDGVVLLTGTGPFPLPAAIAVAAKGTVRIAADGACRPWLTSTGPLTVSGGDDASRFAVHGCVMTAQLRVAAGDPLRAVTIADATIAPGAAAIDVGTLDLVVDRSILGQVSTGARATAAFADTILDAGAITRPAFSGGTLSLDGCTLIGGVTCAGAGLISDSLLLGPVVVERRQEGCVRYSALPTDARAPRRHRCISTAGARLVSATYGSPVYARLDPDSPLLTAASDDGEIGVFHHVGATRRLANLALRLAEHLPAGIEGGIIQRIGNTR